MLVSVLTTKLIDWAGVTDDLSTAGSQMELCPRGRLPQLGAEHALGSALGPRRVMLEVLSALCLKFLRPVRLAFRASCQLHTKSNVPHMNERPW